MGKRLPLKSWGGFCGAGATGQSDILEWAEVRRGRFRTPGLGDGRPRSRGAIPSLLGVERCLGGLRSLTGSGRGGTGSGGVASLNRPANGFQASGLGAVGGGGHVGGFSLEGLDWAGADLNAWDG